ncbi:MAG TPA: hypothetical protein VF190_01715 [Rhodothermales bacterium]
MTGWFHVMLELPVYLLTLKVLFSGYQRYATRLLLLGTLAAGIFMYWYNGVGAFTRRGTYPMQQTEAGVVRWRANEARDYRMIREGLNEIDPSGERAVLSFGHNGGFQYFLRRPNAAPTAHFGISVGIQPPESLVAAVKRMDPPPFLIDNTLYRGVGVPAPRISLTSWEQPTMLNHYERRDRPWFEALMEDCSFAFAVPGTRLPLLRVYDCAR